MSTEIRGRAAPGRFSFSALAAWEASAGAAGLAILVLCTRIPFRTRYLVNWDADQFALGIRHFDLAQHQPHPPGYVGYIALGRLLTSLAGDANSALVSLSIAGEMLAVMVGFLFARSLFGRFAGWTTGIALAASPLFWYYGEVANTYALEPLLVLLVAWPCWRLWRREARFAYLAALALGLAGALRPSTMILLAPLFLLALRRVGSLSLAVRSAAIWAAASAAWAVPLVVLSGGPRRFLRISFQLGDSVTTGTAVWNDIRNPVLVTGNAVLTGLGWELGLFSVFALFGLLAAPRLLRRRVVPSDWVLFCLAWALPGLLTFLLVHIGQVAYVQVFAPALFLSLGPALVATAEAVGRPRLAPALLAAGAAAAALIFFLPARASLADQLRLHDQRVEGIIAAVSATDPATTVVVGDAYGVSSYRTASYYLTGYRRVGIGLDPQGRLRRIFGDSYDPSGSLHSEPIAFGSPTTTYVFLDRRLLDLIGDHRRLTTLRLADGSAVYLWRGDPPAVVGNRLWLGVAPPPAHPQHPS